MLDRIARNPGAPSPHAPSLVHLRTEATRLFAKLDDSCLGGDYVMGHGDLKPSNVMLQAEGEGPLFIDFELAGPNFRGYDVFKLFRARDRVPDESLKYFAEAYLGPGRAKSGSVDAVVAESLLFEPCTWLEAVIFFKFAAVELPGQTDKWDALAASRWDGYVRSVADFDRNLATLERMRRSAATAR
ncbi:hypothetical protein M885DRAFT_506065 [Pelagophyceae sp. CCMP2097]|nr:hypothetical protein M885DRAFT_506065 [Pelagophyceae sp. CCMP2097]